MRKLDNREKKKKKRKEKKKEKRMAFLVATTSLPAVYRPNGHARTTTAGTPHARANILLEGGMGGLDQHVNNTYAGSVFIQVNMDASTQTYFAKCCSFLKLAYFF